MQPKEVLDVLRSIKWVKTTNRKNVSDNACYSMILGLVKQPFVGYHQSKFTQENPHLLQFFDRYLRHMVGDFTYTSIQLNKNLQCKPHRDTGNKGISLIMGFGDYQGGELNVSGTAYNIKNRYLKFKGNVYVHWTEPFIGERYTVTYYTI